MKQFANSTMPRLKDGLSLKPLLSSFSALVFHHTFIFLLLTQWCAGQHEVVGPSQPIVATVAVDIILPCHLEPAVDASDMTVEWARPDLNPRFVHVWRDGVELESKKHLSYRGRTSLSINNLKHGDVSLKLSKVKLSDEGTYRCFIPSLGRESTVELVVGVVSFIVISLVRTEKNKVSSEVVLQCESKGWYPEPEVFWLDAEGKLLSAGPTETVRGPDDLYTVSSRVTVEKRHSNSFTCRVQQKNIDQTRETQIHVPDDLFLDLSCSIARIIVLVVGFMCALAVLILLVLACNKNKTKKYQEDEIEVGERGKKNFDTREDKTRESESAQLVNEEKEKKDRIIIETLMEQKEDLMIQRDKLKSLLLTLNTQIEKNTNNLRTTGRLEIKIKKMYEEAKQDMEKSMTEHKELLQNTEKVLNTTENMIMRMKGEPEE